MTLVSMFNAIPTFHGECAVALAGGVVVGGAPSDRFDKEGGEGGSVLEHGRARRGPPLPSAGKGHLPPRPRGVARLPV
jgi:hypothetical protein